MGQSQGKSKKASSSSANKYAHDIAYLESHTDLSKFQLEKIFARYSKNKKLTQKEFLQEFKKTFPNVVDPNPIAQRVFQACDQDHDGTISFREFVFACSIFTNAPREEKMKRIFDVLDQDQSGSLSCQEVIKCVKQTYDILGQLNMDYNRKGIEVFRVMDQDGDMKVSKEEFLNACLKDEELCGLLQKSVGEEMFTQPN
ncbi:hypothetical protein TCAL_17421 [Tigriopus californicus]|uniref:EF-hand domain-containing protein n=1 Tax=Tigriopus californicus TaxID=6832 RepID=A0A553PFE3_TIGCA|nr:calcium-binding protein M-like [Tigriopus californicus]XP_059084233.1 calcium-binding protein M-like [Tigriopus californicus]XP_059084234.1 calcium-binding protein M-like [Tigriopus californicus]XP_059084235.1 calcium-binding protein M-like [Tigriopus californicus]TRY76396.1 hypothetical protein TCAL_10629 [Tigriopus californicus]TRY76397.1 hypothetical protein TCAL_17421 [Tigriopus californicus]|eukprot:TCALIF_10629-PA protein Name:"Similar to Hpcal1 Hippocalcin-like protein 1 (Rattus norvegicus)" AED:0.27 eAED:0.27 QI:0/0/0/0.33/1/1/3/0/198